MTIKIYNGIEDFILECTDKDFVDKYKSMRIHRFKLFNAMKAISDWANTLNKECVFVID